MYASVHHFGSQIALQLLPHYERAGRAKRVLSDEGENYSMNDWPDVVTAMRSPTELCIRFSKDVAEG